MACTIPTITNITEMREYVLTALGQPVLCIEMTTAQINQAIYDSLQEFWRYLYGEAVFEDYLAFAITAGTSAYTLADDIQEVYDFTSIDGNLNTGGLLWNPTYTLVSDDFYGLGGVGAGSGGAFGAYAENYGQGLTLAGITTQLMYLDEINMTFGTKYRVIYREPEKKLVLIPTAKVSGTGLIKVWRKESCENIFNHILFKRLVVANTGLQWARHLKKYALQLPGGGTISGEILWQDFTNMRMEALDNIKSESTPPQSFFIG